MESFLNYSSRQANRKPNQQETMIPFSPPKDKTCYTPPPKEAKLDIYVTQDDYCIQLNSITILPKMAATITSSIVGQTIWSIRTRGQNSHRNLATSKLNQLHQAKSKITPQLRYMKNITERKSRKLFVIPPTSSIFDTNSLSPAQTIMQFYSAINEKNLKQLEELIDEDCLFEDYSFPTPFQKKKVSSFKL